MKNSSDYVSGYFNNRRNKKNHRGLDPLISFKGQEGNQPIEHSTNPAEYWLSSNIGELIDCPHQPGNLKISKNACLKRFKASEKTTPESLNQANLFLYTVGQGLLRCKTCSIVQDVPPNTQGASLIRR